MTNELKAKILKLANNSGMDIDGDILTVFDKRYYVHLLHKEVKEIK